MKMTWKEIFWSTAEPKFHSNNLPIIFTLACYFVFLTIKLTLFLRGWHLTVPGSDKLFALWVSPINSTHFPARSKSLNVGVWGEGKTGVPGDKTSRSSLRAGLLVWVSGKSLFLAQWWLCLQSFPRTRTSERARTAGFPQTEKRTKSKLNPLLASRWGPKTQATLVEVTVLLLLCLRHPFSLSKANPTTIFSWNKPLNL